MIHKILISLIFFTLIFFNIFIYNKIYIAYEERQSLQEKQKEILLRLEKIECDYVGQKSFIEFLESIENLLNNRQKKPIIDQDKHFINKNSGLIPREIKKEHLQDYGK